MSNVNPNATKLIDDYMKVENLLHQQFVQY